MLHPSPASFWLYRNLRVTSQLFCPLFYTVNDHTSRRICHRLKTVQSANCRQCIYISDPTINHNAKYVCFQYNGWVEFGVCRGQCKDCTANPTISYLSVQSGEAICFTTTQYCYVYKACRSCLCQTSVCSLQSVWSPAGFVIATFRLQIYYCHFLSEAITTLFLIRFVIHLYKQLQCKHAITH